MAGIVHHFRRTRLGDVADRSQVMIESKSSVRDTVITMAEADTNCAFICQDGELRGVFTEHDVVMHVVAAPDVWEQPVDAFMSVEPAILDKLDSALDALQLMNERGFRNLPVVLDAAGSLANVSHYDLIGLASGFLDSQELESDEFHPWHTLRFVNFYGMPSRVPLEVNVQTTLAETISLMIGADRGLASVVDDRGVVIGEFTEHDVFRKVACRVEDLEDEIVGDWMTSAFASTSPLSPISDGLREMAAKRHRFLVLVNETGRPLGVVTFGDIARYFAAAFESGTD